MDGYVIGNLRHLSSSDSHHLQRFQDVFCCLLCQQLQTCGEHPWEELLLLLSNNGEKEWV